MRATWTFLATAVIGLSMSGICAAAESESALADRIFGNADKNKDSSLDDKEILEAKRIFKAAIFQGKKADDLPMGKSTFEKIENAATSGKFDKSVSKQEWQTHVKESFDKKESILKHAREEVAKRKKDADERERVQRLQREKEQLQKKLQQQKKNDNKKPGKKK
jgi:hypothetical protein